jgi:hypothetical protein
MEKFIKHSGSALPLRRSNVDTDQIIPAVYLKRITKSGFEDGLFAAWRNDPSFVLNQPQFKNATILVANRFYDCPKPPCNSLNLLCVTCAEKLNDEICKHPQRKYSKAELIG